MFRLYLRITYILLLLDGISYRCRLVIAGLLVVQVFFFLVDLLRAFLSITEGGIEVSNIIVELFHSPFISVSFCFGALLLGGTSD